MHRLTRHTRRVKRATSERIEQDGNKIGLPIESRAQLCVDPRSSSVDGNRVLPSFELPPGLSLGMMEYPRTTAEFNLQFSLEEAC